MRLRTNSRSPITFQSALRESNPPRQLGSPVPLPLGQGHSKAEGERVELSRLIARPLSGRLPSPVGLTFRKGCGGRNRTCDVTLNRRPPVRAQAPPQSHQSGRRDLNPRSRAPATTAARRCPAEYQAFLRPVHQERPAGVEPALPPRQGGRLPLHHGRKQGVPDCQRSKSTGRDSNPRRRITGAVSLPLDDQCVSSSGTRGT